MIKKQIKFNVEKAYVDFYHDLLNGKMIYKYPKDEFVEVLPFRWLAEQIDISNTFPCDQPKPCKNHEFQRINLYLIEENVK